MCKIWAVGNTGSESTDVVVLVDASDSVVAGMATAVTVMMK